MRSDSELVIRITGGRPVRINTSEWTQVTRCCTRGVLIKDVTVNIHLNAMEKRGTGKVVLWGQIIYGNRGIAEGLVIDDSTSIVRSMNNLCEILLSAWRRHRRQWGFYPASTTYEDPDAVTAALEATRVEWLDSLVPMDI